MRTIILNAGERLTPELLRREGALPKKIEEAAADIIAAVRAEGDEAVRRFAHDFDHVDLEEFRLPAEVFDAALDKVDDTFRAALERAARQIREFHEREV